jgi:hypothetical protein
MMVFQQIAHILSQGLCVAEVTMSVGSISSLLLAMGPVQIQTPKDRTQRTKPSQAATSGGGLA